MLADAESRTGIDAREQADLVAEAKRLVDDGPDKPFLDVHFSDSKNGLIVGAFGMALSTADGGLSWKPIDHLVPNRKHKHIYRIVAQKAQLWLVGEQGALFLSRDGGRSFEPSPMGNFLQTVVSPLSIRPGVCLSRALGPAGSNATAS